MEQKNRDLDTGAIRKAIDDPEILIVLPRFICRLHLYFNSSLKFRGGSDPIDVSSLDQGAVFRIFESRHHLKPCDMFGCKRRSFFIAMPKTFAFVD